MDRCDLGWTANKLLDPYEMYACTTTIGYGAYTRTHTHIFTTGTGGRRHIQARARARTANTTQIHSGDCIRIENKNIHLICNKLHSKKNSSVWLPYTFLGSPNCPNGNVFLFLLIEFFLPPSSIPSCENVDVWVDVVWMFAFERLIHVAGMHDALRYFVTHIRSIFFFLSLSLVRVCGAHFSLLGAFAICKCGRRQRQRRQRSCSQHIVGFDCLSVCSTFLCAVTIAC